MLTLDLDRERWHAQHKSVLADTPGLVPVAKGNGYGFGITRLVAAAAELGVDRVAVGTAAEARALGGPASSFDAVVVLTPHRPGSGAPAPGLPANTVHTVTSADGAAALAGHRVVVECRTSLHRHGVAPAQLPAVAEALPTVTCAGFALHLPLERPRGVDPAGEVADWVRRLSAAGLPTTTIYVSHLTPAELAALGTLFPDTTFRARVGTRLWLGDREAFTARASVLDVTRVERGQRYGYRQRRARRAGHLVVAAGGTAHGVGLAAPRAVRGPRSRVTVLGEAGLAEFNRALSPFRWAGRRRWFAEPPHMQVSLLWVPGSTRPPAVGDELEVEVRMTTTHFDGIRET